jgi:hypothetical protein
MFIYDLFRREPKYDLAEESFRRDVDHFKSYLAYCPKYAIEKYGQSKYHALREQVGLPKSDVLDDSN